MCMEMYVGLTDYDWYKEQKDKNYDEVNFWKPGTTSFKALNPNDLFLFKLKKPYYAIVGGGYFVGYSKLPLDMAWDTFTEKNGTKDKDAFFKWILDYKRKNNMDVNNPEIGCIILTDPFFFEEKDWIKPMSDWSGSIVQGKKYDIENGEGKRVYEEVLYKLSKTNILNVDNNINIGESSRLSAYYEALTKHRIGQGAFRVVVTDAYQRTCAVTGEKVLPVLQAAHIKAFSENGPNEVNNGILLRSDIHTLFDRGYITVDTDYHIDISKTLKSDYENTQDYDKYHGQKLVAIPAEDHARPLREFLQWHNDNVFRG